MKTVLLILCAACPLILCHVLVKRQEDEDNGTRFAGSKEASGGGGGGAYSGNFPGLKTDGAGFSQFTKSGNYSEAGGGSGFSAPGPRSREVAPGVYSFTSTGFIISMFVVTEAGVMVVDPMDPEHAAALLAEIRRVTAAPVRLKLSTNLREVLRPFKHS